MNATYVCYTLKISVFTSVLDCGLLWHNTADWGAYITEINFITVLEAWSPRSRCWQGWFLVRAVFLACGWLPSHCIFIWSFLCRFTGGERESFLETLPLLLSTPVLLGLTPYSYDLSSVGPQPHGLQHARPPYPSPTPRVYSNSCPLSRWYHPTISSSIMPFSCLQSFQASGSFPISQIFASGGQSIGVSASASVLPMNIQDGFPLGWTGGISLQSKGLKSLLEHHSSKESILRRSAFFTVQL